MFSALILILSILSLVVKYTICLETSISIIINYFSLEIVSRFSVFLSVFLFLSLTFILTTAIRFFGLETSFGTNLWPFSYNLGNIYVCQKRHLLGNVKFVWLVFSGVVLSNIKMVFSQNR